MPQSKAAIRNRAAHSYKSEFHLDTFGTNKNENEQFSFENHENTLKKVVKEMQPEIHTRAKNDLVINLN